MSRGTKPAKVQTPAGAEKPPRDINVRRDAERVLTELVGAVNEAWAELRIHRTRVLLSLIGVAVAVTALTMVVGLGAIAQQSIIESAERSSGRPATLSVGIYGDTGEPISREDATAAFDNAARRYGIDYASMSMFIDQRVQFADGASAVSTMAVDVPYGAMHRIPVDHGRWLSDRDADRLAPAIVINDIAWRKLGSPPLSSHPTMSLITPSGTVTAVVIGIAKSNSWDQSPTMYMLPAALVAITDPVEAAQLQPNFEVWVPTGISAKLRTLLQRDIAGALGEGVQVDVNRQDYETMRDDPLAAPKVVISTVAVIVLLLGALGLVNISLVTVRQRIREIGIRRSFGATAGRVFFAVMMESVVGTIAAGVVGVLLAVLIVENPTVQGMIAFGAKDLPPFPVEAALVGMAAATGVGALAGLLPALVAVRVKVIDAIRY
jgi:putative ABC transport system permease protein